MIRGFKQARAAVKPLKTVSQQKRNLSIHEYQSVQLLNSVSTPSRPQTTSTVQHNSQLTRSLLFTKRYRPQQQYGIPTPKALPAFSAAEAESVAKSFGKDELVIKAQVLAGGRGKGHFDSGFQGGVQMVDS
ncbi:hypothetical protein AYX14_00545 [Cryptococcus neoformans]|nr:hypothetical protein AYX14_00545 [Cryptococcus neoformans var. grubii]